ncbi:hypothetical protein AAA799P11_00685, partial [Marine Group I thaumarchaeote SCGC AAA799-P11]
TRKVLERFSANGAVIVSDGEDDESVIPVIQNVLSDFAFFRMVALYFGLIVNTNSYSSPP